MTDFLREPARARQLQQTLQQVCDDSVQSGHSFGLIFRLLAHGETVAEAAAGVIDPREGKSAADTPIAPAGAGGNATETPSAPAGPRPVDGDTLFRLASMTKPVTAAAVLIAQDRGLLNLFDPVSKYLPEFATLWLGKAAVGPGGEHLFVRDRKCTKTLRIWHLISHTNGIGAGEQGYEAQWRIDRKYRASLQAVAEFIPDNFPLDFEPGERLAYSTTLGSDIAARVVEVASGLPFDRFLDQYLLGPIGAHDITFTPDADQRARLIAMHAIDAEGHCFVDTSLGDSLFENLPLSYFCGGAGLAGSLNSYTRFAEMLRCDGEYGGVRVMSTAAARLLHTPWIPPGTPGLGEGETWGLLVRIVGRGHPYLPEGVYGWSGAYGTYFWVDPVNDLTGVLMRNSRVDGCQDSSVALALERAVYAQLRGV